MNDDAVTPNSSRFNDIESFFTCDQMKNIFDEFVLLN